MSYFSPSIDADGIHVPTYEDIINHLVDQYKVVFGEDVYIGEETKDYQMLSVFAKCLSDFGELCIENYNSRNPNYASGNSLDLLLPLVSMRRRSATHSTVILKCTGTVGVVISAGSQAIDGNGYIWTLKESVTIGSGGTGEGEAVCETAGSISAPIGTINTIYTVIDGWTAVTNESVADVGKDIETDDEVRVRRKKIVNAMSNGTYSSLLHSITEIEGVTFADVVVNDTGTTDSDGIPAHSICCVVKGGEDNDVAEAIWKSKAPGVGTYGTTSVSYVDPYNQTNTINFMRPTTLDVVVAVSINKLSGYDADRCEEIIKSAIMGSINNLGIGKSWGVTFGYRDIYNAFAGEDCPFVIASITGQTSDMGSASSVEVPCAFNKILNAEEHITVTVLNA